MLGFYELFNFPKVSTVDTRIRTEIPARNQRKKRKLARQIRNNRK